MNNDIRTRFWLSVAREVGIEIAKHLSGDAATTALDRAAEHLLREMAAVDCQQGEIKAALDSMSDAFDGRLLAIEVAPRERAGAE